MEMILLKEIDKNNKSFEDIKHIDENGIEFWYARELMPILQYSKWQNFKKTINKAMIACENSEIPTNYCFTDVSKPIISGKRKEEFIKEVLKEPNYIFEDRKNKDTILMVKKLKYDNRNYRMVVKLNTNTKLIDKANSVISFWNINDKKLKQYIRNEKIIYVEVDKIE